MGLHCSGRARLASCLLLAVLSLATCEQQPPASTTDFGVPWTTEPEFEIGESVGGRSEASFGLVSAVRVLGGGDRILVVEAASMRATIRTPDGSLLRDVGRPGDDLGVQYVVGRRLLPPADADEGPKGGRDEKREENLSSLAVAAPPRDAGRCEWS